MTYLSVFSVDHNLRRVLIDRVSDDSAIHSIFKTLRSECYFTGFVKLLSVDTARVCFKRKNLENTNYRGVGDQRYSAVVGLCRSVGVTPP